MKGQKTCDKCGTSTGPRAYICKKCNAPFIFKNKSREDRNTKIINIKVFKDINRFINRRNIIIIIVI